MVKIENMEMFRRTPNGGLIFLRFTIKDKEFLLYTIVDTLYCGQIDDINVGAEYGVMRVYDESLGNLTRDLRDSKLYKSRELGIFTVFEKITESIRKSHEEIKWDKEYLDKYILVSLFTEIFMVSIIDIHKFQNSESMINTIMSLPIKDFKVNPNPHDNEAIIEYIKEE